MLLTQKSFEEIYDFNAYNVVSYLQKEHCISGEDSQIFYRKNIDGHMLLHLKYEELRNSFKLMHEQAKKIEELIEKINEERNWEKICRVKAPIDIKDRLEHCGIHIDSNQAAKLEEANITGEELMFEEPEHFSKLGLGNVLTQIKFIKKRIGKLMLQRAFCNSLVRENDEITFWKSTNEKESLAKLCARNGIAYIKYNKKIFLSFNKFMKAYLKINHSSFQKQRFKFFIGDRSYEMLKQELNLNEYLPEKMNELNVTEKSGSSHESVSTTSENMEEKEYITNQAKPRRSNIGFFPMFPKWRPISGMKTSHQVLGYHLVLQFTPETADTIVNSVSEGFLQNQTPQYWINEWISQQTNPLSCEFNSFIESAPENTLVSYGGLPNLFVVNKMPANGDDEELNLFLSEKSYQSSDNHTYYFHTTNRRSSESIIKDGIDVSKCHGNQDFGRTASFHLNDEFRWAAEWGRKRFQNPNTCVILVYDIPNELLLEHDHLDLSHDLEKWKRVVRNSRDGKFNEADDHYSVYGPQAENVKILIKNKRTTPRPSSSKNQLALKERKLTKHVDKQLIGAIIYRTK
ncbi:unnamed protein product [Rhizophagus irregularis]|nr:unnamed protein product [Rhizophagus irregularis]